MFRQSNYDYRKGPHWARPPRESCAAHQAGDAKPSRLSSSGSIPPPPPRVPSWQRDKQNDRSERCRTWLLGSVWRWMPPHAEAPACGWVSSCVCVCVPLELRSHRVYAACICCVYIVEEGPSLWIQSVIRPRADERRGVVKGNPASLVLPSCDDFRFGDTQAER